MASVILSPTYTYGARVVPSDSVNNILGARFLVNTGSSGVFYIRQNYDELDLQHAGVAKRTVWSTTGGGFGNQPANDGVEMVSAGAGDTTQTVTIYYTRDGQGDTVYSDTETLNGVTQVVFTDTDIQKVLGVEMSAAATGIVTIREASGNATITTLAVGVTSSGVYSVPVSAVDPIIPVIYADAATTKTVGIIGTNTSGAAADDSEVLSGTTLVPLNATFNTVTKILAGDLETARTVYLKLGSYLKMYLTQGGSTECGTSWIGVNSTSLGSGVEIQAFY